MKVNNAKPCVLCESELSVQPLGIDKIKQLSSENKTKKTLIIDHQTICTSCKSQLHQLSLIHI